MRREIKGFASDAFENYDRLTSMCNDGTRTYIDRRALVARYLLSDAFQYKVCVFVLVPVTMGLVSCAYLVQGSYDTSAC